MSAFVMPLGAGMPDDERQQPMFPNFDQLLELERLRLERERLKLEREQAKAARKYANGAQHRSVSKPKQKDTREYLPQDKRLRYYASCLKAMREYETAVRVTVGALGEVTPIAIYTDAGGPSPKTQGRAMKRFGLMYPRDWPPSTWPSKPPIEPNGQI